MPIVFTLVFFIVVALGFYCYHIDKRNGLVEGKSHKCKCNQASPHSTEYSLKGKCQEEKCKCKN